TRKTVARVRGDQQWRIQPPVTHADGPVLPAAAETAIVDEMLAMRIAEDARIVAAVGAGVAVAAVRQADAYRPAFGEAVVQGQMRRSVQHLAQVFGAAA